MNGRRLKSPAQGPKYGHSQISIKLTRNSQKMLCQFKSGGRWRYAMAIGAIFAAVAPARALVIESSSGHPAALSATSPRPSEILNRLLMSTQTLNWHEGSDQSVEGDNQIIWPPIDQPLDLRGGYKRPPQSVSTPEVEPSAPTPTLSKADCEAAAAFILAGARARDQGVSSERFMGQLRADLLRLGAEPPGTRWFLHSKMEAQLLLSAATRIYREPRAAAWHFTNFVKSCDAHRASR